MSDVLVEAIYTNGGGGGETFFAKLVFRDQIESLDMQVATRYYDHYDKTYR